MDNKHRTIIFPTKNNNSNENQILKKANIIINTTFENENNIKVHHNFLKSRPKSAAPRIILHKQNFDHETLTKYKQMSNPNNNNNNNNNPRPQTAKASLSNGPIALNNITLTLNVPSKQPTLLERYWKYNKIKKGEILTNRCFDSDDGR
jgi:hypothetical protein